MLDAQLILFNPTFAKGKAVSFVELGLGFSSASAVPLLNCNLKSGTPLPVKL
jgi:hypothetical protein